MTAPPLLPVSDLHPLLESAKVVLLARPGLATYAAGHLPGARHADLDTQLSAANEPGFDPARGGRHPLPPLERWLRQLGDWGIDPDTTVVVYDDQAGANAAARTWWMLRAVGHEDVRVLDGDFREAGELTTELPHIDARPPYPAERWLLPTVDVERVDELRRDAGWRVLDVRSRPRFRGETEPIDPVAGHIPDAINLPFQDNLAGGRFKPAAELRAQYAGLFGDVPAERVVVHCGSGVTACHTLLALEAAGLQGASLYVGSWSEWCRNERPRGSGD
jgi:thiosulfate/3-mercaptopyruvate sulfurtransferase